MLIRLRFDADVSPSQGWVALQTRFECPLSLSPDAPGFLVGFAGEPYQRGDALPSHGLDPVQCRGRVGKQRTIPIALQHAPPQCARRWQSVGSFRPD